MILLKADPVNPAHFLGACGFFELMNIRSASALASWEVDGLKISADPSLFDDVVDFMKRLEIKEDSAWDWKGKENVQPFDLENAESGFSLRMDWWEQRDGKNNSLWKCYSGQMTAVGTTGKMLDACRSIDTSVSPDSLFKVSVNLSSRLNFDPRSAWDAGDTGFSPNEHQSLKEAVTYPFAEFLTSIAIQTFPFQGQNKKGHYFTWTTPLPLTLARVAATSGLVGIGCSRHIYERVSRSKALSFLSFSRLEPLENQPIRRTA